MLLIQLNLLSSLLIEPLVLQFCLLLCLSLMLSQPLMILLVQGLLHPQSSPSGAIHS